MNESGGENVQKKKKSKCGCSFLDFILVGNQQARTS
jgi:hypothetical protein